MCVVLLSCPMENAIIKASSIVYSSLQRLRIQPDLAQVFAATNVLADCFCTWRIASVLCPSSLIL
jgi:hypothetical protein